MLKNLRLDELYSKIEDIQPVKGRVYELQIYSKIN